MHIKEKCKFSTFKKYNFKQNISYESIRQKNMLLNKKHKVEKIFPFPKITSILTLLTRLDFNVYDKKNCLNT